MSDIDFDRISLLARLRLEAERDAARLAENSAKYQHGALYRHKISGKIYEIMNLRGPWLQIHGPHYGRKRTYLLNDNYEPFVHEAHAKD